MDARLIDIQISQLTRLLDTKRVNFKSAYYVIFSDYPTASFITKLLATIYENNIVIGQDLLNKLEKARYESEQ